MLLQYFVILIDDIKLTTNMWKAYLVLMKYSPETSQFESAWQHGFTCWCGNVQCSHSPVVADRGFPPDFNELPTPMTVEIRCCAT